MKTAEDLAREDALLESVARKDQDSFHQLHDQLAGLVYATAYRVLNHPGDAEEVAQDVFTQVWQKASLFQTSRGRATTWVSTMARNRAIDRLRSNRRRFRLRDEFQEARDVVLPQAEQQRDGRSVAGDRDDAVVLRGALRQLTPDQREAIELVYFRGLTQKEAAKWLELPLGTVKARIRRGLARLREIVPGLLDR